MKKLVAVLGIALALTLAGCSGTSGTPANPGTTADTSGGGQNGWVKMSDGRVIYCYFYDRGVSCDWNAKG